MTSHAKNLFAFLFLSFIHSALLAQTIAPRHLEKIAYDSNKKRLALFGGSEHADGKVTFPGNVQTWNGTTWTSINSDVPGNRVGHSWIYHEKEKVTYLISGISNANGERVIRDTWKWNGSVWSKAGSDVPMKTSDGAYDHFNNRLLILGDVYNKDSVWTGGRQEIELWEFKDSKWKQLSADGPQPNGPYEVAYNEQTRSLMVPTWENGKSVVWEWRDEKWNKVTVDGEFPEARNRFALAYDNRTKSVYMFGGRNRNTPFFADFWKWNGIKWEKLETPNMPPARAGATMEAGFGGLILYGGVIQKGPCSEMWIWKKGKWEQVIQKH